MIMYQLAQKLGFDKELVKNYKMVKARAAWTSRDRIHPARNQRQRLDHRLHGPEPRAAEGAHAQHERLRRKTLRAKGGIDKETGYKLDGDYFGLPWPCYGTPALKHPGSPNLYDTSKHVMEGGGNFRANFGVEREGVSLLAGDGSHSKGADLSTGYPEFDHLLLKKLGWWDDLTEAEKKAAEGKNWKTDPSGGIIRVRCRCTAATRSATPRRGRWCGTSRTRSRSIATAVQQPARPDRKYPTHDDKKAFWRLPTLYKTVQDKNKDIGKTFPPHHDLGPSRRFEGGGEETRSNPWLASCSRTCSSRSTRRSPTTAASATASTSGEDAADGSRAGLQGPARQGARHEAGRCRDGVPAVPLLRSMGWRGPCALLPERRGAGDSRRSVNTATTYGYDSVTMMQETKTTLCQIERA